MLRRSADWLAGAKEEIVMNQVAGAAYALLAVWKLTGKESFREAAEAKIDFLLKEQSSEGWWSEYGGPDAGYLSLMLDYLARYHALLPREDLNHALTRATHFLLHFTHPNGTFGGEYLSRNTEYLIPSGMALRSAKEEARMLYSFAAEALQKGAGVTPHSLDDRYLCYILYNWIVAGLAGVTPLPETIKKLSDRRFDIFFEEAGIRVVQNDTYYFVANLRKGGSFRLYGKEGSYVDSGIEVMLKGRPLGISGLWKGKGKIA